MDSRIVPTRPDVVSATSQPRPTPKPPNARFNEVLARSAGTVVQGAELAMASLPGTPLMAVALRGGAASPIPARAPTPLPGPGGTTSVAEGPGAAGVSPLPVPGTGISSVPGVGATGIGASSPDGSIESSLAQSQEMNLYFLQIQEAVNSQNRTYTALSNVLKTEHDTVKNAIGNLR